MRVRVGFLLCAVALALAFAAGYATHAVSHRYNACDDATSTYFHALVQPGLNAGQLNGLLSAATSRCGRSPQS